MKIKIILAGVFCLGVAGCGGGGGGDTPSLNLPPNNPGPIVNNTSLGAARPALNSGAGAVLAGTSAAAVAKKLAGSAGEGETGGAKLAAIAGNLKGGTLPDPQGGGDLTKKTVSPFKLPELPKSGSTDKGAGGSVGSGTGGGGGGLGSGDTKSNDTNPNGLVASSPYRAETSGASAGYAGGGGGGARSGGGEESSAGAVGSEDQSLQGLGKQSDSSINPLGSDDPEDYFGRIDMEENIFKRVEKRYLKKATAWVLQDTREIVPRKQKVRSGN